MYPTNNPGIKKKIEEAVGKPFMIQKRWELNGIGFQKLTINSSSIDIHNLLVLDQNINTYNIELRPKGIIVRFRSLLETYGLIIPYYKLNLYKGKAKEYSVYIDNYFVKVLADTKSTHNYFKKVLNQKTINSNQSPEGF
jgi:predicted acetyltransferase